MRESLMYGSVRGTRGNSRPYRDTLFCCTANVGSWHEAGQSLCNGGPQPVEADMRAFVRYSGFDPIRKSTT